MEHMKLITDARADLNKRTNCESNELSIKTGNDKRNKKRRRKIEKLVEYDENNIIDHDGVKRLQELQEKLEKINKEARGELLKVAQKYNQIYEKRTNVIKYIPDFWLTAFLKHGGLVCTEEENKIFEFLSSIKVEDVKSSILIQMNILRIQSFERNMDIHTKTSGSSIQSAQGKGILDEQSFFNWFSEVDGRDEIGEMIKDELWSDPLICFHHEADEENVDNVAVENSEYEVVKDTEDEEQIH